MRVIHLPRVSSLRQAKQGDSVSSQAERLMDDSKKNNDKVVGVYTDAGKSASISDDNIDINFIGSKFLIGLDLNKRAGLRRAIEELPKDLWDGAKFTRWDRLSRNGILSKILQIYFERYGKKLIPIDDSNEPLMIDIKGVLGQEEISKMKNRIREVRQLRFNNGMMVARPPVGYKLNKNKKTIEIDTPKAKVVQQVFQMASEGKNYKEICSECKLKPQQVYNILKNKVYMGIITFEGQERDGSHQPLISKEIWDKCNGRANA
jgi:site-specific DNA recombinase